MQKFAGTFAQINFYQTECVCQIVSNSGGKVHAKLQLDKFIRLLRNRDLLPTQQCKQIQQIFFLQYSSQCLLSESINRYLLKFRDIVAALFSKRDFPLQFSAKLTVIILMNPINTELTRMFTFHVTSHVN